MRFAFSAQAWNSNEEFGSFRAARTLEIEAHTEVEAQFLARFHACFFRGIPDPRLISIVEEINQNLESR